MNESRESPRPSYLDIFHSAQLKLREGDIKEGRKMLHEAIEAGVTESNIEDFIWYMKGTEAYLDENEATLVKAIDKVEDPTNKDLLQKFLRRLQSGDEPNYFEDYEH